MTGTMRLLILLLGVYAVGLLVALASHDATITALAAHHLMGAM